jgi:hypothetical protein
MYKHIINPKTNRKVSIFSKKGQDILKQYLLSQIGGKKNCPNCYAFTKSEKDEIKVLKKSHPKTKGPEREKMVCEKYGHDWTHGNNSIRNVNNDCCKCWCCKKLSETTSVTSKVPKSKTPTPKLSSSKLSTTTKPSPTQPPTPKPSSSKPSESIPPKPKSPQDDLSNKIQCPHCLVFNDLSLDMICTACKKDMLTKSHVNKVSKLNDTCYYTPSGKKRPRGPKGKACKNKNPKEKCCLNPPHNKKCQWCVGDGCRSNEHKCGTSSSSKSKFWKPSGKKGKSVSRPLRDYIRLISNDTSEIGAIEAGGAGDCLYHSISKGIQKIKQDIPSLIGIKEELYNNGKRFDMSSLRRISAIGLDYLSLEKFVNYYINFIGQESAGVWLDNWSPTNLAIKLGKNILQLTKFNVVHNIVTLSDGNIEILGDTIELVSSGKSICSICNSLIPNSQLVTHKKKKCKRAKFKTHFVNNEKKFVTLKIKTGELTQLKTEVKKQIIEPGNHHWGVDLDVINISNILGIGMIIFRSRGDPLIYCLSNDNTRFNYYMLIYNQDGAHYQLGVIKNKTRNSEHSFYSCEGLPGWLKNEFNRLCKENGIQCPPSVDL